MAYIPPSAGSVAFGFSGGGYTPQSGDSVDAAFLVHVDGSASASLLLVANGDGHAAVVGGGGYTFGSAYGTDIPRVTATARAKLYVAAAGEGVAPPTGSTDALLPLSATGAGIGYVTGTGEVSLVVSAMSRGSSTVGAGICAVHVVADGVGVLPCAGGAAFALPVSAAAQGAGGVSGVASAPVLAAAVGVGSGPQEAIGSARIPYAAVGAGAIGRAGAGSARVRLQGSGAGWRGNSGSGRAVLLSAGGIGSHSASVLGAGVASKLLQAVAYGGTTRGNDYLPSLIVLTRPQRITVMSDGL